jgi:effector-binding domain-containing protein
MRHGGSQGNHARLVDSVLFVTYDVRAERAQSRPLAAVHAEVARDRLGAEIIQLLNMVWPVLRGQGVATGHNVVVYHGENGGALTIDAGVEVPAGFEPAGDVRSAATPSGEAVTVAYFGDYTRMAPAYAAIEQWCAANGRRTAGVSWEVYGDWDDDPARRRTDIYFQLAPG